MNRKIETQFAFITILIISVCFLWFVSVQSTKVNEELRSAQSVVNKHRNISNIGLESDISIRDFDVKNISDELVEVANWNIYSNNKSKFVLMYPKDWDFFESSSKNKVIFYPSKEYYIKHGAKGSLIIKKYEDMDIDKYLGEYWVFDNFDTSISDLEILSISNINLNFLSAKRIEIGKKNTKKTKREITFVENKNGDAFVLSRDSDLVNKKIINTIISTFRFK